MEYFIEISTEKKTHNLRVIAQVAFGEQEDDEFCEEAKEVDISLKPS